MPFRRHRLSLSRRFAFVFGFGKKKEAVAPSVPVTPTTIAPSTVIFTMPDKFLIPDKPKFWTLTKIWIVIGTVLLILGGVVVWVVVAPRQAAPVPPPTTAPPVDTNIVEPPTLPPVTDTNTAPVVETPVEAPVETPPAVPVAVVLPRSIDTDGDGLTDIEEVLFGTDPNKSDTDDDGYPDLAELLQGYNPAGEGKLANDYPLKAFSSPSRYSLLYPTAWTVSSVGESTSFVASADERITVSLKPNGAAAPLAEWYALTNPHLSTQAVTIELVGPHAGIFSPDRRSFSFIDPSRPQEVVVVEYDVGTKTETNFATTFEIIIRSISLQP